MTTAQVLAKIRRLIEEVDTATSDLNDRELLEAVADERDWLEIAAVTEFEALAVGVDQTDPVTYGILPEASLTLQLGTILAYRAAAALLHRAFRGRVNRGELGVSWSSGLESESTLQAAQSYRAAISSLEREAEALVLIMRVDSSASRPQ